MKNLHYGPGACFFLLLLFSTTTVSTGRGTSDVVPRWPLSSFNATFDSDPGLPADSFSLTLGGVPFDFTFTDEGDGGDDQGFAYEPAYGEGNSPSVNLRSMMYNTLTFERATIRRSDGYDFTLNTIFLRNTGGERVYIAAYDDGVQIAARQAVDKGTSATLEFDGSIADELRLWSTNFGNTYMDSFAGETRAEKDFGDLPASYSVTTAANGGANHLIDGTFLGDCVDSDLDGQPSADARGDDVDGDGYTSGTCDQANADDDGIIIASDWHDGADGGAVDVTVSGGDGCLSAWLDWDGDGNFSGEGDHVLDMVPLSAGDHTITFDVPAATFGSGSADRSFFARFRLLTDGGSVGDCSDDAPLSTGGRASGGEVEDYQWAFSPTAVGVKRFSAQGAFPTPGILAVVTVLLAGIVLSLSARQRS